jgi:hypothetical protein
MPCADPGLPSTVLALLFLRLSEKNAALAWCFSLALGGLVAALLFFTHNLWLPPTAFCVSCSLMYLVTYLYRLDTAARRLDREQEVMTSLLGWDPGGAPGQAAASELFGFLSEGVKTAHAVGYCFSASLHTV